MLKAKELSKKLNKVPTMLKKHWKLQKSEANKTLKN